MLKKLLPLICGAVLLFAASPAFAIDVVVEDQTLTLDQPPVIEQGRTLVPMRAIFEALGADVDYNAQNRVITSHRNGDTIVLQVGSQQATVNGKALTLDVAPTIYNSRTLVPVRFIAESLGSKVDWVDATKTVYVDSTVPSKPQAQTVDLFWLGSHSYGEAAQKYDIDIVDRDSLPAAMTAQPPFAYAQASDYPCFWARVKGTNVVIFYDDTAWAEAHDYENIINKSMDEWRKINATYTPQAEAQPVTISCDATEMAPDLTYPIQASAYLDKFGYLYGVDNFFVGRYYNASEDLGITFSVEPQYDESDGMYGHEMIQADTRVGLLF